MKSDEFYRQLDATFGATRTTWTDSIGREWYTVRDEDDRFHYLASEPGVAVFVMPGEKGREGTFDRVTMHISLNDGGNVTVSTDCEFDTIQECVDRIPAEVDEFLRDAESMVAAAVEKTAKSPIKTEGRRDDRTRP